VIYPTGLFLLGYGKKKGYLSNETATSFACGNSSLG
jgi:hypothetical protein